MVATALDTLPVPPSAQLLGWHLLDARPQEGWIRVGFDGKHAFRNPAGSIQGGILCAMLDDTMGPAVFVMTEGRCYTATIAINVNYMAPAKPGRIVAEASVVKLGASIAFAEGRLTDEAGTLLATATATLRVIDAGKALSAAATQDPPRSR